MTEQPEHPDPLDSNEAETVNLDQSPHLDSSSSPLPSLVGTKIGSYTLRRVIGSGGMGTVYEAQQEQPRRRVAIKMMKQGITSSSALRRFEFESQTLARLHHHGIAQVYETGTHDDGAGGVPYFVMEFIPNALKITEYADKKKLGTRERLTLFGKVCDAIQHGHLKGIVHRDIKPGNVLVDSNGQPKIIDFGVARSTDSDLAVTTLQTDVGQLLGTLQYMSPEQCGSDTSDIDTRSDIYALGVVLYQLLTGRLPYDIRKAAIHEAVRMVREEEPLKPSSIDRHLRGDIETIALKALEKERERRYQSAAALEQDIDRYLIGDPISARRATIWYHFKRLAIRHKLAFTLAGSFMLLLIASTVISLSLMRNAMNWQAQALDMRDQAIEDRQLAEQHAIKAQAAQVIAERSTEEALRQAYLGNLRAASIGLQQDQIWEVKRRLEEARLAYGDLPPEEMPFEWRCVNASSEQSKLVIPPSGRLIRGVGFTPDSTRLIITYEENSKVKLRSWDVEMLDEREISDSLHDDYLGKDPSLTVSLFDKNGKATVRDRISRSTVSELENASQHIRPFIFSDDGSRVAAYTRDGDLVTVWDVASGSELSRYGGQDGVLNTFTLSPDGEYLVVFEPEKVSSCRLQLVKADTGKPIDDPDELRSSLPVPRSLSFSPNGSELVVGLRTGPIHVYDVDQMVAGKESVRTFEFGDLGFADSLLFNDDGDVLIAISRRQSKLIRAWDFSTEEVLNTFRDHGGGVIHHVSISPDGERLATVDGQGATRLWDVVPSVGTDKIRSKSDHFGGMALSPDSYRVASISLGGLQVHDLRTGELLAELPTNDLRSPIALIQYSPDGVHLAAMMFNGDVLLWNMLTGRQVKTFESDTLAAMPLMAFNSDGSLLAVNYGSTGSQIKIWDVESGTVKFTVPDVVLCSHLEFSPDSAILYVIANPIDGLRGRDLQKNEWLLMEDRTPHLKTYPETFALSPDGTSIAVGNDDGTFCICDSSNLSPLIRVWAHSGPVDSIAYSPEGKTLATLCSAQQGQTSLVKLWDSASGEELLSLFMEAERFSEIQFSPDGLMLMVVEFGNKIRFWDVHPRRLRSIERALMIEKQRELGPLVDSWFDIPGDDIDRVVDMFRLESIDRTPLEIGVLRNLLLNRLPDIDPRDRYLDPRDRKLRQWLGGKKL